MKRRQAREMIIQALYQVDMVKCTWQEALQHLVEGVQENDDAVDHSSASTEKPGLDRKSIAFLEQVLTGIFANQEQIDQLIQESLKNWSFDRLALVDRAILRLAVYELKHATDVPQQVAINEAVELAKAYGSEQSKKFVNGVLSNVVKQGV